MSENQKKIHHIPPGKWNLSETCSLRERILLANSFEKPKYTVAPDGLSMLVNGGTDIVFFKDRLSVNDYSNGCGQSFEYIEIFYNLSYEDICMCVEYYRDHCISNSAGFPPGTEYIFMPKKVAAMEPQH